MKGYRLLYLSAILSLLGSTFFTFMAPLVGSTVIDHVLTGAPPEEGTLLGFVARVLGGAETLGDQLWRATIAMLLLSLAAGSFAYIRGRNAAKAADNIVRNLKDRLYDHLQRLPTRYHDRSQTGDLVQRCTSDVETFRQFLAVQVVEVGNSAILLGTMLPLMLMLDWRMTLLSVSLMPVIVIFAVIFFGRVKKLFLKADEAEGRLTSVIQENLTGIRVVRAFARREYELQRFSEPNREYRDRSLDMIRAMAWYWSLSDLVSMFLMALVLFSGIHWIATGSLTVGTLFAFMLYLNHVLWPIRQLGRILTDLGKTTVALGRIHEILQVEEEGREQSAIAEVRPPLPARGVIEAEKLCFSHDPGQPTLRDLSFEVGAGETLAILGPSGAGKSTFVSLLLRLHEYDSGSLRLDGQEIRTLDRHWVRDQIGVVMQEPFLFSKTLEENIGLARMRPNPEEIVQAARLAHIDETIRGFPAGYRTLIGERGVTLSGGQRQRVALARAILKDPPILILDDALSAVDAETESIILRALRERRGRHTTIVIAHRLTTLAHADKILVFDHGRIIQMGTHHELMEQEGLYRRLWQIQNEIDAQIAGEMAEMEGEQA